MTRTVDQWRRDSGEVITANRSDIRGVLLVPSHRGRQPYPLSMKPTVVVNRIKVKEMPLSKKIQQN